MDLYKVRSVGDVEFLARQLVEGFITGLHKSPYHGFSVEFAEHRLYNTGESTRHIDWKVFAKTNRLYTKRFEEETNLRCLLVIDNSSSMYYPLKNKGKITFSIMAAAALAYLLHRQRDAVGICTFSENIEEQTSIKSAASHLHKLFMLLETLLRKDRIQKKTAVAEVLHQVAEQVHKRALIVLFSDMFDHEEDHTKIFSALQHLKHKKHEVLVFHVSDYQTELNFDFDERPYEFVDVESGEKIKLQPSQIKKFYQQHARQFYQDMALRCGQLKIDYIKADIAEGFDKILNTYLIKRARMK